MADERNDNGRVTVWAGTTTGFNGATGIDHQLTSDWKVAGVADFNGDGRADILCRNTDGTLAQWLSTGTGFDANPAATLLVPTEWMVVG